MPHIMIQSSHLRSLLIPVLSALPLLAGPLLPGSVRAAEEKKIEFPSASQHSVVKQRIGLTDIEVDYSRPNKNDREISAVSCLTVNSGAPALTRSLKSNLAKARNARWSANPGR